VISPIELRTERVYGAGNSHALFDEAWDRVENHFIGVVPSDTVREHGAIRGALSTLNDRYTTFTEPQSRAAERDHMRGSFGGIGVNFTRNDAGQIVLAPRDDGPAAKAGVKAGDILIKIDGVALAEDAPLDDVSRIRGEVGTPVTITVKRGDKTFDFTIVRQVIEVDSVAWRPMTATLANDAHAVIGYIRINSFTERTGKEVQQAVQALNLEGAQAYLIDLRDNGGGLLSAAVDVASEFVKEGPVVIEKKRNEPDITLSVGARSSRSAIDKPVAVLINGNTASASEIVAAAIQDYERGPLVGEKSFGKGSVQLIFDLDDGSAVRVTTARWLTPDRRELDGIGLTPDVVASGGAEAQRNKAIQILGEAIAAR
jgi:carboxyl-terminal processing protease